MNKQYPMIRRKSCSYPLSQDKVVNKESFFLRVPEAVDRWFYPATGVMVMTTEERRQYDDDETAVSDVETTSEAVVSRAIIISS